MKLNDYGSPKSVPSFDQQLTQEQDGRYVKPRKAAPRRKKGEKSPYRLMVERNARISAAYAAWRKETGSANPADDWNRFERSSAYQKAWKGETRVH